jgi:flagellar biosynthesis/type III secretory pathway chaperone
LEQPLSGILEILHKLTGLHRQLLDCVRSEREALVQADTKAIESVTAQKQGLIETIRQTEIARLRAVNELATLWNKPARDLTLPNIVIAIQGRDPKGAEQLRSVFNALTILIQRITDSNKDNQALVERSLEHVRKMTRNVLGEAAPRAQTYDPSGQRANQPPGARLISKEA